MYKLYVEEEFSQRDIAKAICVSQTQVRRLLAKYEIPSRTDLESSKTDMLKDKRKALGERYSREYLKPTIKECKWCKAEFSVGHEKRKNIYCSQECMGLAFSDRRTRYFCSLCGEEIVQSGKKYKRKYCDSCAILGRSISQTDKVEAVCGHCGKTMYVIRSVYTKNEYCYCDYECMGLHYSERFSGENSPTWKGGKSHHYIGGFHGARKWIRARDSFSCQRCGISEESFGKQMSVHHIKNYRKFEDKSEANAPDNLVCLCEPCHRFIHSKANTDKMYLIE